MIVGVLLIYTQHEQKCFIFNYNSKVSQNEFNALIFNKGKMPIVFLLVVQRQSLQCFLQVARVEWTAAIWATWTEKKSWTGCHHTSCYLLMSWMNLICSSMYQSCNKDHWWFWKSALFIGWEPISIINYIYTRPGTLATQHHVNWPIIYPPK